MSHVLLSVSSTILLCFGYLVLAGLVHPRQHPSQHPFRFGVLLERHLVTRLGRPDVELSLAVQRLERKKDGMKNTQIHRGKRRAEMKRYKGD